MRNGLVVVAFAGVLGGLACVHTNFTPTTGLQLAQRPENCYLDVILQGQPPYPHVVIGQVSTDSTAPGLFALGENNSVAMERIKEEACRVGAHGLLKMEANSHGVWTNNGYSKSTTGGAVAFIYVDPSGRPLPPPNGPRVVIQPGHFASQPAPAPAPGYAPAAYSPPPQGAPPAHPPSAVPPGGDKPQ
jgi:hypothetical protein